MKSINLVILLSLALAIGACNTRKRDRTGKTRPKNQVVYKVTDLTYEFDEGDGCKTKQEFASNQALCEGLQNQTLNKKCALKDRKRRFAEKCADQKFEETHLITKAGDKKSEVENPKTTEPKANEPVVAPKTEKPTVKAEAPAAGEPAVRVNPDVKPDVKPEYYGPKFSYDFDDHGCKTGKHEFETTAELCVSLRDNTLNKGCAVESRETLRNKYSCKD